MEHIGNSKNVLRKENKSINNVINYWRFLELWHFYLNLVLGLFFPKQICGTDVSKNMASKKLICQPFTEETCTHQLMCVKIKRLGT